MKKILDWKYLPLFAILVVAGSALYIGNHFKQPPMDELTVMIKDVDENRAVNTRDWSNVQNWLNSNDPDKQVQGLSIVQGSRVPEQMAYGIKRAEDLRKSSNELVRVEVMITLYALGAPTASDAIKAGVNDSSQYVKDRAIQLQMKLSKKKES